MYICIYICSADIRNNFKSGKIGRVRLVRCVQPAFKFWSYRGRLRSKTADACSMALHSADYCRLRTSPQRYTEKGIRDIEC